MTIPDPAAFTADWVDAWNDHDVERVLAHFHDQVVFTSPVARRVLGTDGVVHGKEGLRAYWTLALEKLPDLHFDVENVYAGVSTIVINYRNQLGALVDEVLIFDGDLVVEGHGTYREDAVPTR